MMHVTEQLLEQERSIQDRPLPVQPGGDGQPQTALISSRSDEAEPRARVRRALAQHDLRALLAFGDDNFTYVTGVALPYAPENPDRRAAMVQPADGEGIVICPIDWAEAVADQGWGEHIQAYDGGPGTPPFGLARSLVAVLRRSGLVQGRIGLDASKAPEMLVTPLRQELPEVEWVPFERPLGRLRTVKTPHEIDLLEAAAAHSQKGMVSALNHTEGTIDAISYTVAEFAERIRVHVGEFGGSGTGHVAAMQGSDARHYFVPPHGRLQEGNLVRMEVTNHHLGYWSNAGRTVVIGEPTAGQAQAYRGNIALRAEAIAMLRPGVHCSDVFAAVVRASDQSGIPFWREVGVGHGVGASEREAPYLVSDDPTPLEPGMVLVVAVYSFGPGRELIVSKDTFAITEDGRRLLSWYRNWDRPYVVSGITARHG